jgi:hypothetical protein
MPQSGALEGAVRPNQLPDTAPARTNISPYSLASNQPIVVTPGMGGTGAGQLPPVQLGQAHFDQTITFYLDQAAVEKVAKEQ